jgi:hypothetical protein
LNKANRRSRWREKVRAWFITLDCQSMPEVLQAIADGYTVTVQIRTPG